MLGITVLIPLRAWILVFLFVVVVVVAKKAVSATD